MSLEPHESVSYHARIDAAGCVTIPADLRSRHGLRSGDEVVLVPHSSGLEIKTYERPCARPRIYSVAPSRNPESCPKS
ncbi:MAG: AbrB/MazE/SpoVT family DNA-binding domain-containing protein [Phycisphaerales bacterium]